MTGSVKNQVKQIIPSISIMIIMVVITSIASDNFFRVANIRNILTQSSAIAIAAIAQSLVLFIGGIDMSVGSIISFATIIMALFSGETGISFFAAVCLTLLAGAAVGLINGIGVVKFQIPAMIITISTQAFIKGINLILMPSSGGAVNSEFVKFMKTKFSVFTVAFIFVLLLYAICYICMHYTKFGRNVYAVGNNVLYAQQSGIAASTLTIKVYVLSGIFAAISGIVLSTRLSVGNALVGDTYSMDSVTAAVVGGISMNGGVGTVVGALFGALVLSLINNVMNNLGIYPYYQYIIKGGLLMISIMLFQLKRRRTI